MYPVSSGVYDRMQSMDTEDLANSDTTQGPFWGEQEKHLQEVTTQVPQLAANLARLTLYTNFTVPRAHLLLSPPWLNLISSPGILPLRGFLLQCCLYFTAQEGSLE